MLESNLDALRIENHSLQHRLDKAMQELVRAATPSNPAVLRAFKVCFAHLLCCFLLPIGIAQTTAASWFLLSCSIERVNSRAYDISVVLSAGQLQLACHEAARNVKHQWRKAVCTGCDGCVWRVTAGHAPRAGSAAGSEGGGRQPTGAITAGWDGHGAGVHHPAGAPAEVEVACAH